MGRDTTKILVAVAFVVGFFLGYKAKERRILWLKRKRDRLADKLVNVQTKLDLISKNA